MAPSWARTGTTCRSADQVFALGLDEHGLAGEGLQLPAGSAEHLRRRRDTVRYRTERVYEEGSAKPGRSGEGLVKRNPASRCQLVFGLTLTEPDLGMAQFCALMIERDLFRVGALSHAFSPNDAPAFTSNCPSLSPRHGPKRRGSSQFWHRPSQQGRCPVIARADPARPRGARPGMRLW